MHLGFLQCRISGMQMMTTPQRPVYKGNMHLRIRPHVGVIAFGNALGNSIVSGLTTSPTEKKVKESLAKAQSKGATPQEQQIAVEQALSQLSPAERAKVQVTTDDNNIRIGLNGSQGGAINITKGLTGDSLVTQHNSLLNFMGENNLFGNSEVTNISRFMYEKRTNYYSKESVYDRVFASDVAKGMASYNFHNSDSIAFNQRFAQNSSNIASANQSMYNRAQASANMSTLDKVQLGLDVTGMSEVPVVSQLADLGSAGISLYNGDYVGAGLSMGSMIPVAGKAFEGTRAARFAERIAESTSSTVANVTSKLSPRAGSDIASHAKLKEYYASLDPSYIPSGPRRVGDPINFEYANRVHPTGVRFTPDGYPDFEPFAVQKVEISQIGNNLLDFKAANIEAGIGAGSQSHYRKMPGYTWHHHQNGTTMLLVPTKIHGAPLSHSGGAEIARKVGGLGY